MIASALFMGLLGVAASFLPQELLVYLEAGPHPAAVLMVQVAGALYLGFAAMNWMARENLIGGVYSRPLALGNFMHFVVVTFALGRILMEGAPGGETVVALVVYAAFAVGFGVVLFTHPGPPR